jgi:hypothetical protein
MVARWGMSDAVGPLALGDGREDGELLPGGSPVSPATQQTVDEEARRIVETAEREVIDLLEREQPRPGRARRLRCSSARRSTSPRRTAWRTSRRPPRSRTATASGRRRGALPRPRQAAERVGA